MIKVCSKSTTKSPFKCQPTVLCDTFCIIVRFLVSLFFRRFGRLWRSWMLSKSCLPHQSTMCIRSKAHWCLATETTASYNRFILWTNEIPYRRRKLTKLCQTRNIQRKVRSLTLILIHIQINKIDITLPTNQHSTFSIRNKMK